MGSRGAEDTAGSPEGAELVAGLEEVSGAAVSEMGAGSESEDDDDGAGGFRVGWELVTGSVGGWSGGDESFSGG